MVLGSALCRTAVAAVSVVLVGGVSVLVLTPEGLFILRLSTGVFTSLPAKPDLLVGVFVGGGGCPATAPAKFMLGFGLFLMYIARACCLDTRSLL